MFKRLPCSRIDCPDTSLSRRVDRLFTAPLLHRMALGCSLPLIGFLAGDELQAIPKPARAKPVFHVINVVTDRGSVVPIQTRVPDSGVRLISFQEEVSSPIPPQHSRRTVHAAGKEQLISPGQQPGSALKTPPRLDDTVGSSGTTENVGEQIEKIPSREQSQKELRQSVNPLRKLPLSEPASGAEEEPETPEPASLRVEVSPVKTTPAAEPVPVPVQKSPAEPKIVEVIQIPSEPRWMVMNRKPAFGQRVLGHYEVRKLLTRSRMELAVGELDLAHAFAEAASEVTIPRELFDNNPELILTEIEYVTARDKTLVSVKYNASREGGPPGPDSPTQRLEQDPGGFRAIGTESLTVRPPAVNSEGESQRIPEAKTRSRLALTRTTVHSRGIGRGWSASSYSWAAPALYHSPLYYEEVELERYGNEICFAQPFVSGARFYLTPFTLPYQMGIEDYGLMSCQYDLGHERPGACVPYSIHALPFSWTGAVAEAGFATGLAFLIP